MISAGDFKNGLTIELEGNVFQIVDFQHVKPGKGAAFVRTKMKNIKNGGVVEKFEDEAVNLSEEINKEQPKKDNKGPRKPQGDRKPGFKKPYQKKDAPKAPKAE